MKKSELSKEQLAQCKEKAKEFFLKHLGPEPRLYGRINHVAKSGTSRRITLLMAYLSPHTNLPVMQDVTQYAYWLTDFQLYDGLYPEIVVKGSGFNHLTHVVESLSFALYGFCKIKSDRL